MERTHDWCSTVGKVSFSNIFINPGLVLYLLHTSISFGRIKSLFSHNFRGSKKRFGFSN